jgi:hypothetical protein
MTNINIETIEEPEPFEPDPDHIDAYNLCLDNAMRFINQQRADKATASAVLAVAAQIARIADAVEYAAREGL